MPIPQKVTDYLNNHNIAYEAIHHSRDYTAQETARDTHTKGRAFAKTVVLYADGTYCMLVLPAVSRLDMNRIKQELHCSCADLATEEEMAQICPDCEIGAMPPFGELYDMPVYVDSSLGKNNRFITCNAGTHEDAVRLLYEDFCDLVKPSVAELAKHFN